ncbi:MAG TPA: 5-formyltetrahydrofolate cyclo-ligase [Flavobacteriales bacterium]|nr:5-formyltetrahydrofolate cyclo-ligase [Flavobacteriales bacterium]
MIAYQKKTLRQRMLVQRDACGPDERSALSERIITELEALMHERRVKVLHSFLPMGSEVEIFPLLDRAIANGIAVYAPKTLRGRVLEHYRYTGQQHLVPGVFGTKHPAGDQPYTGTYDMIIVPGLAFTPKGDRLGYGAGYYDTFLPQHPKAFTVAVCFPFQVVDDLPVEAHDSAVDRVVIGA